jgi:hypothetical protein
MRSKSLRLAIVGAAIIALMLLAAASAYADVHVTDRSASSVDTQISLESTGDAGQTHGNANPGTSPVDSSGNFYWFNQDVWVHAFQISDIVDGDDDMVQTGGTYSINSDGSGYGAPTAFDGEPILSAEGVYSITGVGVDVDDDIVATGTAVEPAFGIDKTPPTSSSDATTAYVDGSATINIEATDAMSGVQDVRTSLDSGPWQYTYDGTPTETDVAVTTMVPGPHSLIWQAFDNAGNVESHMVSFIVYVGETVDIDASAGAHGQIAPNGTVAATINADQAFTITPDAHYHVADVLVDGKSVGATTTYTFDHVTAPHTISASFAVDTNDITSSAGAHGAISPLGVTPVPYGGSQTYNMQPYSGYRIADVLVDGSSVGAVSSYTFTGVTAPRTISVSYVSAFPTPFAPSITLKVKFTDKSHHNLQFYGTITAMAVDTRMTFTQQRWTGKKWVNYGNIYRTIPAGTSSYSFPRSKSRHSKYRTKVSDSGGATGWVTYTIN